MTTWGHLMLASLAGTRSASSEFFLQARAEVQVRGLRRGRRKKRRPERTQEAAGKRESPRCSGHPSAPFPSGSGAGRSSTGAQGKLRRELSAALSGMGKEKPKESCGPSDMVQKPRAPTAPPAWVGSQPAPATSPVSLQPEGTRSLSQLSSPGP